MPPDEALIPPTLEKALNKLKHRDPAMINFSFHDGAHSLFIFTQPGMGQANSISAVNIEIFCLACRNAATYIL